MIRSEQGNRSARSDHSHTTDKSPPGGLRFTASSPQHMFSKGFYGKNSHDEKAVDKLNVNIRPQQKKQGEEQKATGISGSPNHQQNVKLNCKKQKSEKPRAWTQERF